MRLDARKQTIKTLARALSAIIILHVLAGAMTGKSAGGHHSTEADQETTIDWDRVKSNFEKYLRVPSAENAKLLLDALPMNEAAKEIGDGRTARGFIHDSYIEFEARVLAGDRCLIEIACRLLSFSDAAFSEALEQMLGNLAGEKSRLYLEFLFKYRNGRYIKHKGPPILETKYYQPEGKIPEWTKRIRALRSVREPKYKQLRDECIRLLTEAIKYPSKNGSGSALGF